MLNDPRIDNQPKEFKDEIEMFIMLKNRNPTPAKYGNKHIKW